MKGSGWIVLITLPTLSLVECATRRRGGVGGPASLLFVILVLAVLGLAVAPFENAVSRRYEAEADWHALNATRERDARSGIGAQAVQTFERTSLDDPSPPLWGLPVARRWQVRRGRPSRAATGCP